MSRRRMISSDIWEDEKIGKLSHVAKLLFIGMITLANDAGKVRGNTELLKSKIFPYGLELELDLDKEIKTLAALKLIYLYEVNKESYILIFNWEKHQVLTYKGVDDLPSPDTTSTELSRVELSRVSFPNPLTKNNKCLNAPLTKEEKEYKEMANLLKDLILKNNPKARLTEAQTSRWEIFVRLMIEHDERTIAEIKEMIIFSQQHDFWHKNILSMEKLRKQFDRLTLEKDSKHKKTALGSRERSLKYELKNQ